MTTDARRVPTLTTLYGRVRLESLERTEPGDVFYLVRFPWFVYRRSFPSEFEFQELGTDQWYEQHQLGEPSEVVVILHNTRKYCTSPPQEC